MKIITINIGLLFMALGVFCQSHFDLRLETFSISGMPGLHSFTYAKHDGKWLLIGGRKDGLHQKFNGFQVTGANQSIYVVDPAGGQVWEKPLATLPDSLRDQLGSTNMEFLQLGETLVFVGGYGHSQLLDDHTTFPLLTVVQVPEVMAAVIGGDSILPFFQQVRDTFFAVTGGQLQMVGDTFYLVGGHRFEGLYSASNGGSGNFQFYTNAIRKFTLEQVAGSWQVQHKSAVIDELNLHRRDYNLLPQIFENGESGISAFSGVFQPGLALLPFQNIVEIRPAGHATVDNFTQYLANYHCAKVPLYDGQNQSMHTLFFGGMSQYYLNEADSLIRDNRIPFVKTISRVTRLSDGSYEEVAFDAELPYLTGSGAEFILAEGLPLLPQDIVDYAQLPDGETLLGYIVGGIVTPEGLINPFVANQIGQTSASTTLLKVFLIKNPLSAVEQLPLAGNFDLRLRAFPNPATHRWQVEVQLPCTGDLLYTLQDANGKILWQQKLGRQPAGSFQFSIPSTDLPTGTYHLSVGLDGVFVAATILFKS